MAKLLDKNGKNPKYSIALDKSFKQITTILTGMPMRLRVKEFGPIHQVDIDFEKLTVIIGKNNLGKSYLAQLYYTILDCSKRAVVNFVSYDYSGYIITVDGERFFPDSSSVDRKLKEKFEFLLKRIKSENLEDPAIIDCLINIVLAKLSENIESELRLSLEKGFGEKISKLVSVLSNQSRIKWDLGNNLEINVQITKRGRITVEATLNETSLKAVKEIFSPKALEQLRVAREKKYFYLLRLYREVERNMISKELVKQWHSQAYYIPAGRGGLIESYETVVSGLVSLSPLAPVRGLSLPPLPGMAAQFYSVLLKLKGHKGPLSRVVTDSFRQMLQGEIELRRTKNQPKYRINYRFSSGGKVTSTNVIHAASMIKEIAPIFLIVQELVEKDDYLLIEEPESHLHPGAQIRVSRVIGDIASNGVNVLITTQSDILLRALGHLVGKNPEQAIPLLSHKEIAIYWLREGEKGCVSETVKLSKNGILEDIPTFDDIIKELYETEQKLQNS